MHGAGKKITTTVRQKKPPSLVATEGLKELIKEAKQVVKDIVAQCKEDASNKYTDKEFRASDKSLWLNRKEPRKGNQIKKPTGWARVTDICPNGVLFDDNTNAGDVVQGELSDCWLLGGCSAVLTGGLNLKDLFVAYDVKYGVYCLRFFIEGDWFYYCVDDLIPVDVNNKPVYGRNKNPGEFWVMILEKAFAKVYGSYEGIHFGYETHAMESLTGGVVTEIDLSGCNDEKNKNKYLQCYKTAFIIMVMPSLLLSKRKKKRKKKKKEEKKRREKREKKKRKKKKT